MENLLISVAGMHTATCAEKIEKTLSSVKGVKSISVNFSSQNASISFDESTVDEKKIFKSIEKLGYKPAKFFEENEVQKQRKTLTKKMFSRMVITGSFALLLFFAPVLLNYVKDFPELVQNAAVLILALFTVYIGYFKTIKNAVEKVINLKYTNDALPALGLLVLIIYTVILTLPFNLSPYINRLFLYQSITFIAFILTFSKWLELNFENKLKTNYENLKNLQPKRAVVVRHNTDMEVDIENVKVGDLIKVKPGEAFPVDGILVEGETKINETILLGSEEMKIKKPGDEVVSATVNIDNTVIFKATQIGKETTLSQVIASLDEAKKHKGFYEKTSTKVEITFTVITLICALGSFVFWYLIGEKAWVFAGIISFSSLTFISSPFSFVFGTLTPLYLGIEKAAVKGILFKGSRTIENTSKIKRIIIDKTGILTVGVPEITNIITKEGYNEKRFLIMIGSLENASTHPFAEAIVTFCENSDITLKKPYDYKNIEGMGIIGTVDGQEVIAGNMKLMEKSNVQTNPELMHKAEILSKNVRTPVFVARNRELVGVIGIADTIKPESKAVAADLTKLGLKLTVATGDNEKITQNIADELRIKDIIADAQQKEKIEAIQDYQTANETVAFVGEGINDGPILAQADVGIAIGAGTDAALSASDITFLSDDLNKITQAYTLAKQIKKTTVQNLLIASGYNLIALLGAFGVLFPIVHLTMYPALAPLFSTGILALLMKNSKKSVL